MTKFKLTIRTEFFTDHGVEADTPEDAADTLFRLPHIKGHADEAWEVRDAATGEDCDWVRAVNTKGLTGQTERSI
jgi:hypothetical protein